MNVGTVDFQFVSVVLLLLLVLLHIVLSVRSLTVTMTESSTSIPDQCRIHDQCRMHDQYTVHDQSSMPSSPSSIYRLPNCDYDWCQIYERGDIVEYIGKDPAILLNPILLVYWCSTKPMFKCEFSTAPYVMCGNIDSNVSNDDETPVTELTGPPQADLARVGDALCTAGYLNPTELRLVATARLIVMDVPKGLDILEAQLREQYAKDEGWQVEEKLPEGKTSLSCQNGMCVTYVVECAWSK